MNGLASPDRSPELPRLFGQVAFENSAPPAKPSPLQEPEPELAGVIRSRFPKQAVK